MYVLAARRRCLEAVDVDSQQLVYVPLSYTVRQQPVVPTAETVAVGEAMAAAVGARPGGRKSRRKAGGAADAMEEDGVLRVRGD